MGKNGKSKMDPKFTRELEELLVEARRQDKFHLNEDGKPWNDEVDGPRGPHLSELVAVGLQVYMQSRLLGVAVHETEAWGRLLKIIEADSLSAGLSIVTGIEASEMLFKIEKQAEEAMSAMMAVMKAHD